MLKEWQFNVIFVITMGGIVFLLVAPGNLVKENPLGAGAVGTMLAYILSQKRHIVKNGDDPKDKPETPAETDDDKDKTP